MKEAAGEANMTVITIVLIAIVLGVGTIIVTTMMRNAETKTDNADQSQNCKYNTETNRYECN